MVWKSSFYILPPDLNMSAKKDYAPLSIFTATAFAAFLLLALSCSKTQTQGVNYETCRSNDECQWFETCVNFRCIANPNALEGDEDEAAAEEEGLEAEAQEDDEASDANEPAFDDEIDEKAGDELDADDSGEEEPELPAETEKEEEQTEAARPANDLCENAKKIELTDEWRLFTNEGALNESLKATEGCLQKPNYGADVYFGVKLKKDQTILLAVKPAEDAKADFSLSMLESCKPDAKCLKGSDKDYPSVDFFEFKAPDDGDYIIVVSTHVTKDYNPLDLKAETWFLLLAAAPSKQTECGKCSDRYGLGRNYCSPDQGCYAFIYDGKEAERSCLNRCEKDSDCKTPFYACKVAQVEEDREPYDKFCVPSYTGVNIATCSGLNELGNACIDAPLGGPDEEQCGADDAGAINDAPCVSILDGLTPKPYCAIPCQGGDAKICPPGFGCKRILATGDFCLR